LLQAALDEMQDIIYCPRKSCQLPVVRVPEETLGTYSLFFISLIFTLIGK